MSPPPGTTLVKIYIATHVFRGVKRQFTIISKRRSNGESWLHEGKKVTWNGSLQADRSRFTISSVKTIKQ